MVVSFLLLVAGVAALWSVYKYQVTYVAVMDLLPPQFQDGLTSPYAFPEYVLRPSTPLGLQADYVTAQAGFCIAALCVSLLGFLLEKPLVGLIALVMFLGFAALTFKSWKTYLANVVRRTTYDDVGDR